MTKNNIRKIRLARGLTQEALAEMLGVTHATVQRHENGKRKLTWDTIRQYAAALKCHPSEITDDQESVPAARDSAEDELLRTFRGLSDGAKEMYLHTLKSFSDAQAKDATTVNTEPKKGKKYREKN